MSVTVQEVYTTSVGPQVTREKNSRGSKKTIRGKYPVFISCLIIVFIITINNNFQFNSLSM